MQMPRRMMNRYRGKSPLKVIPNPQPRSGVPATLLEGKRRGNLVFTGSGVRLRRI